MSRPLGFLTLENIQTDSAQFVDVWMVDFCKKSNLGRGHRIVFGQEQL